MKRPKRDNSRTKSVSVIDSYSFNGHRLSSSNSSCWSPSFSSDESPNHRPHRRTAAQHQTNNGTVADVMNKMPKMNGTTSRGGASAKNIVNNKINDDANSNNKANEAMTRSEVLTEHGDETRPCTVNRAMFDSPPSSSSPPAPSSTLRPPFDHLGNLLLCQQPVCSSNNFPSLNGTPCSSTELPFPFPTTSLLHQLGVPSSQLVSVPISYGPFGLPQIAGVSSAAAAAVAHQPSLLHFPFHHFLQQQRHQQLLPPLPVSQPMNGVGLMGIPQNAFEGLPIFVLPQSGTLSLSALKRAAEFKTMALNALVAQQGAKMDTTKHFHIFVGDLSPEVDNQMLMNACQKFGIVSEAKVMRDPQSSKSRSFGFVAFLHKEDAQRAIEGLNGMVVGTRPLRTGWAVRRSSIGNGSGSGGEQQHHGSEDEKSEQPTQRAATAATFEAIYNATEADNSTVYLGGLPVAVTEEPIRSLFSQFGTIKEIRLFASQNFGFIVFADKSSATRAIFEMHGRELDLGVVAGKCTVRVKWGRQTQQQTGPGRGGGSVNVTEATGTALPQGDGNTVLADHANTIPTLMELGQQSLASGAAAAVTLRLVQQQQQQQLAALSALAIQQQLQQHHQQMVCLPNAFHQSSLLPNQTQNIANGTMGCEMATIGAAWGNNG